MQTVLEKNEANARYRRSEKGRVTTKRYRKEYRQSEAGKATEKRYNQSEKVKAAVKCCQKKLRQTVKGHLRHIYYHIKNRCTNTNCSSYKHYGGRGIKVCFKSSDEFVDYVINVLQQDSRGLTIDRIDSDGHYEPGNIWFCTRSQNSRYVGKDHFGGIAPCDY